MPSNNVTNNELHISVIYVCINDLFSDVIGKITQYADDNEVVIQNL